MPEDDPKEWDEGYDNQSYLEFPSLPNEDLEEPMEMLSLQPRQAKARQGKVNSFTNSTLASQAVLDISSAILTKSVFIRD